MCGPGWRFDPRESCCGMRSRRTGEGALLAFPPAPRNRKNRCVHHLRHVRLARRDLDRLTDSRSSGSARPGLFASVKPSRLHLWSRYASPAFISSPRLCQGNPLKSAAPRSSSAYFLLRARRLRANCGHQQRRPKSLGHAERTGSRFGRSTSLVQSPRAVDPGLRLRRPVTPIHRRSPRVWAEARPANGPNSKSRDRSGHNGRAAR